MEFYDLVVIGGGSGGFGAALAAARRGLSVLLVEAAPLLGGNSTLGGVNVWEPGIGGPGFHGELYERLSQIPDAIALSRTTKFYSNNAPWGLSQPQRGLIYRHSLRRAAIAPEKWTRVVFEPQSMAHLMAAMLSATGKVTLRLNARFVAANAENKWVKTIETERDGVRETVHFRYIVDATAQLHVATALGCQTYLGAEPRSRYDEPSAPEEHIDRLNGVSLIFRVTPTDKPAIQPLPCGVPDEPLVRPIAINEYPNGDLNMNALPVMEGWEWHSLPPAQARAECERRVRRIWRTFQKEFGFERYRLKEIFPLTGVREGPRLVGRRVLTENDVRDGYDGTDVITLADHALDTHGEGHLCRELDECYGVPFDCLLPREYDNLMVACRGASFSHLAASSCRLSRTMMQLGHAAGLAASEALSSNCAPSEIDPEMLRHWLEQDDVALSGDDRRFPGFQSGFLDVEMP